MYKSFVYIAVCFLLIDCGAHTKANQKENALDLTETKVSKRTQIDLPKIEWQQQYYDFKSVKVGTLVSHTFHFKNIGQARLIIEDVHTSCGCTVPAWPKHPILPQDTSSIRVKFDTKGRNGVQNRLA